MSNGVNVPLLIRLFFYVCVTCVRFHCRHNVKSVGSCFRLHENCAVSERDKEHTAQVLCRVLQRFRMCKIYLTYQEVCFFIAYLKVL